MPVGYLVSVALVACCSAFALAPLRRPRTLGLLSWWLGLVINELPFVAFYWILATTLLAFGQGDIDTAGGWVVFSLAVLTSTGLGVIAWRGWRAGAAVVGALNEGLGTGWRGNLDPVIAARLRRRLPWFRILVLPIFVRRRDVERLPNIGYGDAGRWNLLDLYRPRFEPPTGPTLVYLHGGGFFSGRKSREARPLLYRLASQGWVCLSAYYRLRPAAAFPDHLIDLKKVICLGARPRLRVRRGPRGDLRRWQLCRRQPGNACRSYAEPARIPAGFRAHGHLDRRGDFALRLLRAVRRR